MTLAALSSDESPRFTPVAPADAGLDWPELHRRHARGVRLAVLCRLRQFGERIDPERVEELAQEVWCRLIERDRAIALWEEASGLSVDPVALAWWETFACVKGIAIWLSSAREFADGKSRDPVMAAAAWFLSAKR